MKNLKALLLALVVALALGGAAQAAETKTSFPPDNRSHLLVATGVNVNSTSSVTGSLFAGGAYAVAMQVVGTTGTHSTHVVKLQGSVDNENFVDTATTVTGEGGTTLTTVTYPFYRLKVTTAEGTAATATLALFVKNQP